MFRHVVTTADGIWNTVVWSGIPLVILILNRDEVVEGTDLSLAVVALPGFLGLMIAAAALGPAYYIAAEREDGTVLRAKAVPYGILGYVTGVLTQASPRDVPRHRPDPHPRLHPLPRPRGRRSAALGGLRRSS